MMQALDIPVQNVSHTSHVVAIHFFYGRRVADATFQDRASAILGGDQWQVPEFALPSGVSAAIQSSAY
jgi:hypothetical protein